MKEIIRAHHISFKNAFAGLGWAIRTQPNFRIHFVLAIAALWLGTYLGITRVEMLIIFFTVVLGLVSEMINTSIESMTDLITREWRAEAKVAKDVAAGMMLLVAMGSIVVAVVIFGPYVVSGI